MNIRGLLKTATAVLTVSILSAQTSPNRQAIAKIAGQEIYEEDLQPVIGAQLWQLKNQEYDLKTKAIEFLVSQRLLQERAKAKGVSPEVFLEQAIEGEVPPPSASDVQAFYLAQKDRLGNQKFEDIKAQLEQSLTQARREQARQQYFDNLRQDAVVKLFLTKPKAVVTVDPLRVRGNPAAPVTILEFADYQCPYCQAAEQGLKQVLEKYKDKVRLAFRDFPLQPIHPQAQSAAEASRCAEEQGKFWEYHDLLFANQTSLGPKAYVEHARSVDLDVEQFGACLASGKFRAQIENDYQAGASSGVTGTPAFWINGVMLTGAQPLSAWDAIIQKELAAKAEDQTEPPKSATEAARQ